MARPSDTTDRSSSQPNEAERYRAAAEMTLDQLEWCIGYLYRIRKPRIAAVLAQNHAAIRRQLT